MTNEQFWAHVDKTETCWLWTWERGIERDGYVHVNIRGVGTRRGHRYAWEQKYGVRLAAHEYLLHSCDVPHCVNPDHCRIGTQQENIADRDARGRTAKGVRHHYTTLTEDNVYTIRRLRLAGFGTSCLGRMFAISHKTAERICTRLTWKHLPEEPRAHA